MNKMQAIKIGAAKRHQTKPKWKQTSIATHKLIGTLYVLDGNGPEGWRVYYGSKPTNHFGFETLSEAKLFCEGIAR